MRDASSHGLYVTRTEAERSSSQIAAEINFCDQAHRSCR